MNAHVRHSQCSRTLHSSKLPKDYAAVRECGCKSYCPCAEDAIGCAQHCTSTTELCGSARTVLALPLRGFSDDEENPSSSTACFTDSTPTIHKTRCAAIQCMRVWSLWGGWKGARGYKKWLMPPGVRCQPEGGGQGFGREKALPGRAWQAAAWREKGVDPSAVSRSASSGN